MRLYDSLIGELSELTDKATKKEFMYSSERCWPETKDYELIMQRDTAYELGASGKEALNYTLITSNDKLLDSDKVVLYGPDISKISGANCYARISVILVKEDEEVENDTDKLYHMISDIDFVKYHIYPKGYMVRTSGQTTREQVRIGKKAIKNGMDFERIGNTFIKHYKEDKRVLRAGIIFITDESLDFSKLKKSADKATEIRNSLNRINEGMPTECSLCGIKDICSEIEGLKELHFGKSKNKSKNRNKKREKKIIITES